MASKKSVSCAAVDLGATSGRVIVGTWSRGTLTLKEVHRFANQFHSLAGHDYWDLGTVWTEVRTGLIAAAQRFPKLASVGVDTWGVDHALIDRRGRLVFPVHAYRDVRTQPGLKRLATRGLEKIYAATGIPNVFYNTSLQLQETLNRFPTVAATAKRCLLLSDYFNFLLSGHIANELSNASTTQLLDVHGLNWSRKALNHFGIPPHWFAKPISAGTDLGPLTGISELDQLHVIAVPGHDTACAYDAMPASPEGTDIFLSSGTWSLVGFESDSPLLSAAARRARIANERIGDGRYRPLTNIIGLWLLEQTLRDFAARPTNRREWAALIARAENLPRATALLDTRDPEFANPKSMRIAIDTQLRSRKIKPPTQLVGYVRLICDSLGRAHAEAVNTFEQLSGRSFRRILMTGGGAKNACLCQATADAAGRPVVALQIEGTAVGNLARQLIALGAVEDLPTFRRHWGRQLTPHIYHPHRP